MQIKRTISKNQCSEIDDFINRLQVSDHQSSSSWIQPHLNNSHVQRYFSNLHKHITNRSLHHFKGYQSLIDGLYILLKGQIKIMHEETNSEKSKLKKLKTSKSSINSTGAIINQTWSVFECTYKNCTATVQSFVLRITEEQATVSNFYQLFEIRKQIYFNRYLSQDHHKFYGIPQIQKPFFASLKIHSHFSFKTFYFREIVWLQSPAIVFNGRAKLKVWRSFSRQFDKYGVLLPNLKYQVASAEITLMIIENNESLSYDFQLDFDKVSRLQELNFVNSVYKTEICTPKYAQSLQSQKQTKNNYKQRSKVFKQSEQYSIISTFLCEKSLNFAKKHNIIHHTKEKKENRCKSPLILFDIVNQNSKISTPKFQSIHPIIPNDTSKKYLSAHKVSSQSECSQTNLLRKVKLSPAHFSTMIMKNPKSTWAKNQENQEKMKRTFHLTLDRKKSQKMSNIPNDFSSPNLY